MTYFAPVAPLTVHRQLAQHGALGPYHLLIASEINKNPTAYGAFWNSSERGHIVELFVDNGIIELGYPLPINELIDAVVAVHATTVILPDTIDDMRMTVKQVRFAANQWRAQGVAKTKMLGVVQGRTIAECADCADAHVKAGVDMLAIPRGLTPNLGSRVDITKIIAAEHNLPIHLLGFSHNIADDIAAATSTPLVLGIDSATPVWLGMGGRKGILPFAPPRSDTGERRPSWFWSAEKQYGDSLVDIIENLKRVRSWLSEGESNSAQL